MRVGEGITIDRCSGGAFGRVLIDFANCLADILVACRELRSFRYNSPLDDRVTRELSALFAILESFSGSLEAIQIMCLPSATVDKGTPRSLSAFKKLRDVACDASVLTHPSRKSRLSALLPPNIQKVHIHNIYADFVRQFGGHACIRKDMSQSVNGTRLFTSLCEVKLVKGILSPRHVLESEQCIEARKRLSHCIQQPKDLQHARDIRSSVASAAQIVAFAMDHE